MSNHIFYGGHETSVFRITKLSGLLACLLWLVHFGALGKPEAPKKIIVLAQSVAMSNNHLKKAYETHGHEVVVTFLNSSTRLDEKRGLIYSKGRCFAIKDFDLAYFRTWGQEEARNLAHAWQPVFERHGVPCVEPLQTKLYSHNKHTMMRLFYANGVPMPKTLIARVGTPIGACIAMIKQQFDHMMVIKGEGSGGKNLSFMDVNDEQKLRKVLANYSVDARIGPKPLVLQQYVPRRTKLVFLIIIGSWLWGVKLLRRCDTRQAVSRFMPLIEH